MALLAIAIVQFTTALHFSLKASGTESGAGETTTTHARPAHLLSVERYAISADENRFTVRLRNTTEEKLNFVIYAYGQEKGKIVWEADNPS